MSGKHPLLVDKYLEGAEIEVDAICDGKAVLIPGIMQHVAARLAAMRLLEMDAHHIKALVRLGVNVPKDDVALVVKDDARLTRLHQLM